MIESAYTVDESGRLVYDPQPWRQDTALVIAGICIVILIVMVVRNFLRKQ